MDPRKVVVVAYFSGRRVESKALLKAPSVWQDLAGAVLDLFRMAGTAAKAASQLKL